MLLGVFQQLPAQLVGNQNRHQRLTLKLQAHLIHNEDSGIVHLRLIAESCIVLGEGQLARVDRIGLTVLVACRGGIGDPPVIEHLRDMVNPVGFLDAAKQEIIVLGTIIFSLQKANLIKKGSLHNHKMTDVINTMQVVRIKSGLK